MSAPLVDLSQVRRLLIIRLSSIGDVVHALPVSAALGEAHPDLEITWVVEEMSAPVVEGNPYLHDVIVIPRGRWKKGRLTGKSWPEQAAFLKELRRRRFDVTLDLQGYGKSGLLALATGAKYRYGWWRLRDLSQLASRPLPHRPESLHRVEWYLDAVRALGVDPNPVRFPLSIPESARSHVRCLLEEAGVRRGQDYALLNPATGDEMRRWGKQHFAELAHALAEQFNLVPVLIGSSKDDPICRSIASLAAERMKKNTSALLPIVLAGKTDLKQLAALLDGAAIQIAGDTGSLHIGAALGKPVVALFGPTDPAHAGPWGQPENVICHRSVCAPTCTARACAFSAETGAGEAIAKCMRTITPTEVLSYIERVLTSAPQPTRT